MLALLTGGVIGFLVANRFNRGEIDSLRSENSRLAAKPQIAADEPTLSDDEIRTRIQKADETPADIQYQRNLGVALYRYASMKKDVSLLAESIRLLKRVGDSDPADFDINVVLGNAYFDLGYFGQGNDNYDRARKYYENAISKKPDDASVRTDYGLTFFLRVPPEYDRAIGELDKALAIDSKNEKALEFTTQAYLKIGDLANANITIAKLESVNPNNTSIVGLKSELKGKVGLAR